MMMGTGWAAAYLQRVLAATPTPTPIPEGTGAEQGPSRLADLSNFLSSSLVTSLAEFVPYLVVLIFVLAVALLVKRTPPMDTYFFKTYRRLRTLRREREEAEEEFRRRRGQGS